MSKVAFLFALVGMMFCGCAAKSERAVVEPPSTEEVERIYNLFLSGQYEAYVSEMMSCDGMPDFYRHQMVDLHKQHAHEQKQKNGEPLQFQVERIDLTSTRKQANVFLKVVYENQNQEVVMVSMVHHKNKWRLE